MPTTDPPSFDFSSVEVSSAGNPDRFTQGIVLNAGQRTLPFGDHIATAQLCFVAMNRPARLR